jgi:hypothetical protein
VTQLFRPYDRVALQSLVTCIAPTLPAVIAGLFAAALPKPQSVTSQLSPGIGCAGLFIG